MSGNGNGPTLQAPYPFFGGKSKIARRVWRRFGDVANYVEPFAGSLAMLLGRPRPFDGTETVNDVDGMISNFWRSVQADPDAVAHHADWPVIENDMHARHIWLVNRKDSLQVQLEGDPEFFDAKVAGWWVWGICSWIGSGWCSGEGPWQVVDGQLVRRSDAGQGINQKRVHLGGAGQGIKRQQPANWKHYQGVIFGNRNSRNDTCEAWSTHLRDTMQALADRLWRVRVCCGDWTRVCGPTPTVKQGLTAVFLDPPYAVEAGRDSSLYSCEDLSRGIAQEVRSWCAEHGHDPRLRIVLCGYEGEGHEGLESQGWIVQSWKAKGGYSTQSRNGSNGNEYRERIWCSPHCVQPVKHKQMMFELS
jgi:site-specific DNA-adenine methylase